MSVVNDSVEDISVVVPLDAFVVVNDWEADNPEVMVPVGSPLLSDEVLTTNDLEVNSLVAEASVIVVLVMSKSVVVNIKEGDPVKVNSVAVDLVKIVSVVSLLLTDSDDVTLRVDNPEPSFLMTGVSMVVVPAVFNVVVVDKNDDETAIIDDSEIVDSIVVELLVAKPEDLILGTAALVISSDNDSELSSPETEVSMVIPVVSKSVVADTNDDASVVASLLINSEDDTLTTELLKLSSSKADVSALVVLVMFNRVVKDTKDGVPVVVDSEIDVVPVVDLKVVPELGKTVTDEITDLSVEPISFSDETLELMLTSTLVS